MTGWFNEEVIDFYFYLRYVLWHIFVYSIKTGN